MNFLIRVLIFWFVFISVGFTEEVKVFDFTQEELSKLEIRKIRGADNMTIYTVGSNENGNFLKAVAENAASGLGKELKIDLNKNHKVLAIGYDEKSRPWAKDVMKRAIMTYSFPMISI